MTLRRSLPAALRRSILLPPVLLLAAAPLAAQEPAAAAEPQLTLDQRMMLRCSAAFALVANRQGGGEDWALAYPPLAESGREFFVRATARLIDETGSGPEALEPLLRAEAEALLDRQVLQAVMPVCLALLPPAQ